MKEFNGFDHLNGDAQREGMKGWGPSAHSVVEPILYRRRNGNCEWEFLVCRRLTGALSVTSPPACTTSNPGGHHVLVGKDDTPVDAVIRSLEYKLGYQVTRPMLESVGIFGPALNKSSMEITGDTVRLIIHDEPAEPDVPFIAHVFAVRAQSLVRTGAGNGSLEEIGWFTLAELVERFGASKSHIYFQYLFQLLRTHSPSSIAVSRLELFYPHWRPGVYQLELPGFAR